MYNLIKQYFLKKKLVKEMAYCAWIKDRLAQSTARDSDMVVQDEIIRNYTGSLYRIKHLEACLK